MAHDKDIENMSASIKLMEKEVYDFKAGISRRVGQVEQKLERWLPKMDEVWEPGQGTVLKEQPKFKTNVAAQPGVESTFDINDQSFSGSCPTCGQEYLGKLKTESVSVVRELQRAKALLWHLGNWVRRSLTTNLPIERVFDTRHIDQGLSLLECTKEFKVSPSPSPVLEREVVKAARLVDWNAQMNEWRSTDVWPNQPMVKLANAVLNLCMDEQEVKPSKTPYTDDFLKTAFPPERIAALEKLRASIEADAHAFCVKAGIIDPDKTNPSFVSPALNPLPEQVFKRIDHVLEQHTQRIKELEETVGLLVREARPGLSADELKSREPTQGPDARHSVQPSLNSPSFNHALGHLVVGSQRPPPSKTRGDSSPLARGVAPSTPVTHRELEEHAKLVGDRHRKLEQRVVETETTVKCVRANLDGHIRHHLEYADTDKMEDEAYEKWLGEASNDALEREVNHLNTALKRADSEGRHEKGLIQRLGLASKSLCAKLG